MKKLFWIAILMTSFVFLGVPAYAVNVGPPYHELQDPPKTITGVAGYDLIYHMTVDDAFEFYLSQDDFTQGTLIGTGNSWTTIYGGGFNLTSGSTYYLHVVGRDQYQTIAGFLGEFTLSSDNPYIFQNGTKKLLTGTSYWTVRTNGWDNSFAPVTAIGPNGSDPWSAVLSGTNTSGLGITMPGIDPQAQWIWTNNGLYTDSPRYFSTKITITPEPISAALFLVGGGLLACSRRKNQLAHR